MKVAYVAGPYRSKEGVRGIVENIRRAESLALHLWNCGYAVICPHKNTALFDGAEPDDVWLDGDLAVMRRCDAVFVMDNHEHSSGVRAEIAEAQRCGIPIHYYNETQTGWCETPSSRAANENPDSGNKDCNSKKCKEFRAAALTFMRMAYRHHLRYDSNTEYKVKHAIDTMCRIVESDEHCD